MDAPGTQPLSAAVRAGDGAWTEWPAPAKLNLFLRITGRRPDGHHLLQTVFQLLAWGDCIRLRTRVDGVIRRVGEGAAGVAEADDLVVRAAKILQKAANCALGADIYVEKNIPMGGGFGGGSSDAASVLVALDALWGTGLGEDALLDLGTSLGADVPVFVRGADAWAEGVGEVLAPITLPPAWYVVLDPSVHASTAALFQAPDLTRDAAAVKMADFIAGPPLGNVFEPVLRRQQPAVEAAFAALARIGPPRLTGSGSGCFVGFDSREAAEAGCRTLEGVLRDGPAGTRSMRAWVAASANGSPLRDALARWRATAG